MKQRIELSETELLRWDESTGVPYVASSIKYLRSLFESFDGDVPTPIIEFLKNVRPNQTITITVIVEPEI
jgi:hypothetical protein